MIPVIAQSLRAKTAGSISAGLLLSRLDRHLDPSAPVKHALEMTRNTDITSSTVKSHLPARRPLTGIDVLITGAGMGGLMSALECWRKGHNVVGILERNDGPTYTGSISGQQF